MTHQLNLLQNANTISNNVEHDQQQSRTNDGTHSFVHLLERIHSKRLVHAGSVRQTRREHRLEHETEVEHVIAVINESV